MGRFILAFVALAWIGCSRIVYTTKDEIPVLVGAAPGHYVESVVIGEKSFYLWGLAPATHHVYLDRELLKSGVAQAASITVEEYQSFTNTLLTVISFGLYVPKNYRITAYATKAGDR